MFHFEQLDGAVTDIKPSKGKGDDAEPIATIKVQVSGVSADAVAYALGADNAQAVRESLFRDDADQNSRYQALRDIRSEFKKDNAHRVRIGHLAPVRTSCLYDLRITPRAFGRCDVRFVFSTADFVDDFVDKVAKILHAPIKVTVEQDPELPFPERAAEPLSEADTMAKEFLEGVDRIGSKRAAKMKRKSNRK